MLLIVCKQDLHVQCPGTKFVPLGMDIVIVDSLREFKFAVGALVKRRKLIFFRCVKVSPVVIWFDVLQNR